MLVLRLARTGRKKTASYRLVAADKRRAATGKFVERLGHYNPYTKEFVYNKEAVATYIKNGAQPSGRVVKLLKKDKMALPKWAEANLVEKKKAPKSKGEKAEGEAKPAEAAVDAPKEGTQPDAAADKKAEASDKAEEPKAEPEDKKAGDAKAEKAEANPKDESKPDKTSEKPENPKSDDKKQ